MKRTFALLLALLMMAGLLAGCGGGQEEKPSTAPSATTSTAPSLAPSDENESFEYELPLTDEDISFTYWVANSLSFTGFNTMDDSLFIQWLEAQTGVDLIFEHPAVGSEREAFQTMILSGDYPEFIQGINGYYTAGMDKAIEDGIILRLNEYVDQYMPNYRQVVYGSEDLFIQAVSDQGNLWGVHHITDRPQGSYIGPGVREDWLTKAGLTTADCETIDGMENVLTAFKEYTYDNEGPLFLATGCVMNCDAIASAYGFGGYASGHKFANENGKVVYNATKPEFAEYAAKLADWYAKGLVNKNVIADNSWSTPQDRWANGEVGIGEFIYTHDEMLKDSAAVSQLQPDPDFQLQAITAPKLDESQDWSDIHFRNSNDWQIRPGTSMAISTSALPNIELACHFWDYAWTDEGKHAANWGPYEGEKGDVNTTYYIDETDANGDGHVEVYQPWLLEQCNNNASYIQAKASWYNGPTWAIWSREWSVMNLRQLSYPDIWEKVGSDWIMPTGITLTREEGDAVSAIVTNADSTAKEWLAAVITGEKSADTWETEVLKVIEGYGIHEAEGYYQAALDRYNARIEYAE